MKKSIFVTGLFRSGTTWLARALNSHPEISFESDPIAPIFNSFRYDLANNKYKKKNSRFSPLEDYFDSNEGLLKSVLNSDFKKKLNKEIGKKIFKLIKEKNLSFENGKWTSSFKGFENCKSYFEAIKKAMQHIDRVYQKDSKLVGFKEVWTNEMVAPFLRSFKGSKSIIITRDPRSVLASRNVMLQKYPPIFVARQWRKSIFIENYLKRNFKNRIFSVKYEDLISDKKKYFKKICKFLKVKFNDNLLNEDKYLDGLGNPWKKNSSFSYEGKKYIVSSKENYKKNNKSKKKFLKKNNLKKRDKWKTVLTKNDIKTIEFICYHEMKYMNYKTISKYNELDQTNVSKIKTFPLSELADWIKPYAIDQNKKNLNRIIYDEKKRHKIIKKAKNTSYNFRLQII